MIDYVLKGWYPELSGIIEKADSISTSQYSKMEIKKGFIHYWVLLYNKAVTFKSYEDIEQFKSNLSSSPKRYYSGACNDASLDFWSNYSKNRPSDLAEKYGNIPIGEILLDSFKTHLGTQIRLCFHRITKSVKKTYNPMQCFKDLREPVLENGMFNNKPLKCYKSMNKCNIAQYIRDNKTFFEKILEKLEGLEEKDTETAKRINSLKEILKIIKHNRPFSNHDQNQDLCWNCGDAIHAVISPDDSTLLTRNVRHFEPICEAIGKKFRGYSSPKTG